MAKDPAFLFYPGDWMLGTMVYTLEEKGAFLDLLILQFNRGEFTERMAISVCGGSSELWGVLKEKFQTTPDGKFFNDRLKTEKEKRESFSNSRRNNRLKCDNTNTCVYLMYNHMSGHTKIGSSNKPQRRLLEIQSQHPEDKITLLAFVSGVDQSIETELQRKHKPNQVFNEWYDLDDSIISNIISEYHMINHMVNENEIESGNEVKTETEKKPVSLIPENFPFKSEYAIRAMNEYITHRKQLRLKPYTKIGLDKAMKEWETWGEAVFIQSVDITISKNYQGLFHPKDNYNNGNQRPQKPGGTLTGRVEPAPHGTDPGKF